MNKIYFMLRNGQEKGNQASIKRYLEYFNKERKNYSGINVPTSIYCFKYALDQSEINAMKKNCRENNKTLYVAKIYNDENKEITWKAL